MFRKKSMLNIRRKKTKKPTKLDYTKNDESYVEFV